MTKFIICKEWFKCEPSFITFLGCINITTDSFILYIGKKYEAYSDDSDDFDYFRSHSIYTMKFNDLTDTFIGVVVEDEDVIREVNITMVNGKVTDVRDI